MILKGFGRGPDLYLESTTPTLYNIDEYNDIKGRKDENVLCIHLHYLRVQTGSGIWCGVRVYKG